MTSTMSQPFDPESRYPIVRADRYPSAEAWPEDGSGLIEAVMAPATGTTGGPPSVWNPLTRRNATSVSCRPTGAGARDRPDCGSGKAVEGSVVARQHDRSAAFAVAFALVLLAGLMPAAMIGPRPVAAADPPVLGGQLFATGQPVEVEVLPASAGYTSELWLFEPGPARRLATNRDVGTVVSLGTFPAGVELIFGITVLNTGNTFKMGPGDRNPDGIPHATVQFLEQGKANVAFEDLLGGGDRDYNDNMFQFRGGIVEEPPSGPTADAGPDQTVDEGAVVTLDATGSSDTDSQNLTYAWTIAAQAGPPIILSSSSAARPTFQTTDDGTYRFQLAVSDGTETDTDEVVITVRNVVPVLSAQADPAYAGGVALVSTTFTDAGVLDTHTASIDWGDGTPSTAAPVAAQGSGWGTAVGSHVYAIAGSFTVRVTITDDDGGSATTTVAGLEVLTPVALWANSSSSDAAMESTSGKVTVWGLVHTNDDLRLRGDTKTFHGPVEYAGSLGVGGNGAVFDQTPLNTSIKPFPFEFAIADYRPGGRAAQAAGSAWHDMSSECGADGFWHVNGSTLASGIYYVTCGAKLNGNPLGGTITLVAEEEITVSGTAAFFDPYTDGLLFLSGSSSTNAIRFDTSDSSYLGFSFAKTGGVTLTGAGNTSYCGILADRIDIAAQDLRVRGSGCGRPAHTNAPPTLVPNLTLDLAVDQADSLPGRPIQHTATITNAGSTLVVPGILGLENLATSGSPVGVASHDLHLETLSAADGAWHPLVGTVTFHVTANAASGVTYPTGSEVIDGTQIGPDALASWGYAAIVQLDPTQTNLLLDTARTLGVRVVSSFTTDPVTAPVRRLFRFGDDLRAAIEALGADATNVQVTILPSAGDAATFQAPSTAALGTLAPGASVVVDLGSTVPAPAPRAADEPDAAYLARLRSFDGTPLTGVALARGTATIGPVFAPAAAATTTRHLPVVAIVKIGPADIESGQTAAYQLAFEDVGSADASGIVVSDAVANGPTLTVTGAPTALAAGANATATATYAVPASSPSQTLDNAATVRWTDAAGGAYGPLSDHAATRVITPRRLAVTKSGFLRTAADGSQSIDYEIAVTNLGDTATTDVALEDTPDALTAIVAGSVTTTQGTVTTGNEADATAIHVAIGTLAGRSTIVVAFSTTVLGVPEGVVSVTNQAMVTSTELAPIVSDDPEAPGAADPTVTPVGPTAGSGGGGGGGEGLAKPTIDAPTPADGTTVTEPTTISTTITPPEGQAVASWKITATRAGVPGETTLDSGNGAGIDEAVTASASFDPTALPNGTWLIAIRSTASGGGVELSMTSLIVDGFLKLGRYTTTWKDMAVTLGGVDFQVLRTYDSTDKSVGDFGVGWHLDLTNLRVSTNGPLGRGGWTRQAVECGLIFCKLRYSSTTPHFATVTWPDGHQEIFDFQPQDGSTFFAPLTAAGFKGRSNTTSTLEVEGDNSLTFTGDGNLYGGAFGIGGIFDAQRFRLTDSHGTTYVLDRTSGLVSLTNRTGETLTVTPTGVTSSLGPQIGFTRDAQSRITRIAGPAGETIDYGYTGADLTSVVEGTSTYTYTYNGDHDLLVSKANGQPFLTSTYGADGRIETVTDSANHTTTIDLDLAARTETVTSPSGRLVTINSYDTFGNLARTDQTGDGRTLTWRYGYDPDGRPNQTIDPLGHETSAVWDDHGNLTDVTDANHQTIHYTYGEFGELLTRVEPGSLTTLRNTFVDGNLTDVEAAGGVAYHYDYDGSRVSSVRDSTGSSIAFTYTPDGQVASATGDDGRARLFTYDGSGRMLTIQEPGGTATTTLGYDAAGNLASVRDGLIHTHSYDYDPFDRLTKDTDALGRAILYTYDGDGRLLTRRDRNGDTTTYTYDADGRLATSTLPGGVVTTYEYDAFGQLTRAANPDSVVEYTYDDDGNIASQHTFGTATSPQPDVTLAYAYDPRDAPSSVTGPAGTVRYSFDERYRLDAVRDPAGDLFDLGYDAADRLTSLTRPNGVTDTLTWNSGNELLDRTSRLGSTVLASSAYTYDGGDRRATLTDLAGSHGFTLDDQDRLTAATHPAGSGLPAESYAYDAVGNRTSWSGNPAASVAYDNTDRLLRDARFDYTYDGAGDLIRKVERSTGAATTYDWNADGRLVAVHLPDSSTIRYRYDALGRRIEVADGASITRSVYDGANVALEYDGSNALTAAFVTSVTAGTPFETIRGAQRTYPIEDGLGSAIASTDQSGAVVARYTYGAFGQPGPSSAGTYSYTGYTWDARTGLYYARARYYDPGIGRFISPDPLPSINPYPYVDNDPVDLIDPFGAQSAVESALQNARTFVYRAALGQIESSCCIELVKLAALGLGLGPNALGAAGEGFVSQALGGIDHGGPIQVPGTNRVRIPDFNLGSNLVEVKNTKYLSLTSQLRDMIRISGNSPLTIVTRAGTKLSGPLLDAIKAGSVRVIGCLPG